MSINLQTGNIIRSRLTKTLLDNSLPGRRVRSQPKVMLESITKRLSRQFQDSAPDKKKSGTFTYLRAQEDWRQRPSFILKDRNRAW